MREHKNKCIVRYILQVLIMGGQDNNGGEFYEGTPSAKFYGLFQFIFNYYNDALFNGTIDNCLIVITQNANVMGHFAPKRWFSKERHETDELALNPAAFIKYPLIEICQTIVHEMVHAWQYNYGRPSRDGYHNREWADMMIAVGLKPSSTGEIGGRDIGQQMPDYPITGGDFMNASEILMNSEVFQDIYYEINPEIIANLNTKDDVFTQIKDAMIDNNSSTKKPRTKIKYSCGCSNVWGRPSLNIFCFDCGESFTQQ